MQGKLFPIPTYGIGPMLTINIPLFRIKNGLWIDGPNKTSTFPLLSSPFFVLVSIYYSLKFVMFKWIPLWTGARRSHGRLRAANCLHRRFPFPLLVRICASCCTHLRSCVRVCSQCRLKQRSVTSFDIVLCVRRRGSGIGPLYPHCRRIVVLVLLKTVWLLLCCSLVGVFVPAPRLYLIVK